MFKLFVMLVTLVLVPLTTMANDHKVQDNQVIDKLPNSGFAVLSGIVSDVDSKSEFTLKDVNGDSIEVETSVPIELKEGDKVQVNGQVDSIIAGLGKRIKGATVQASHKEEKKLTSINPKAINEDSGTSAISNLPERGHVVVRGTVSEIQNDGKTFILKDNLGETIDVNAKTRFGVKKSDHVIVMGIIQSEIAGIGEEIIASNVQVIK